MDFQQLLFNLSELFMLDDNDLEDKQLVEYIMSMGEPSILGINMMKDRGNSFFREGNIPLAVGFYKFALNLYCFLGFSASHDQQSTSSLALSLVLNLAACDLKLSHYNQVCCYCNLVLKFDPCNVTALYRRGLEHSHANRLTEALKDFERALQLYPNNTAAKCELVDVVDRLVVNPNDKRVASPFDPLGSSNKGKKILVSNNVLDKWEVASCSNVQLLNNAIDTVVGTDQAGVSISPDSTMDLDADDKSATSDTFKANPSNLTFSNKKQAKNKLNLSSQGYENLIQGKNLEFFHPRSMSFMRVCPLMSKTIQMGTPLEEISGQVEVPLSSPLPKQQVHCCAVVLENDKVVQEHAVFQITKKKRISSGSAQVSKISAVRFEFVAVRERKSTRSRSKVDSSRHRNGVSRPRASVHPRDGFSSSVDFSSSLCRYINTGEVARSIGRTKLADVTMRAKRKKAGGFHFDEYYYPLYKKCRIVVSVYVSCSFRSVCWLSSSLGNSDTPGFVL